MTGRKRTRPRHGGGVALALMITSILGITAIFPGMAAADPTSGFWHRANPPLGGPMHAMTNWLFLLDGTNECLSTITTDANVAFVVMQGFGSVALDKNPIPTSPGLLDPTTYFHLAVDGTAMPHAQVVWVQALAIDGENVWVAQKMDYTRFPGGMTGYHVFDGMWFLHGALVSECVVGVTFV